MNNATPATKLHLMWFNWISGDRTASGMDATAYANSVAMVNVAFVASTKCQNVVVLLRGRDLMKRLWQHFCSTNSTGSSSMADFQSLLAKKGSFLEIFERELG